MEVTHEMAVMFGYAGELEQAMPWLLKAAEIAETRRIRGADLHNVYAHLGLVLTFLGQVERAEPYAYRAISLSTEVGTRASTMSLNVLSRIARAKGDQRRAVRLRAAATALLAPGHPNPDAAELRKLLPLDPGLFEPEWRIGYAMTRDQAVAYAMEGAGTTVPVEAEASTPDAAGEAGGNQLSAREIEVIAHVARGQTNREISRDLYVSEHTVASHIRSILAKIGAASRAEAAAFAVRRGMAGPDPGPTRPRSPTDAESAVGVSSRA
jgi:DNA-binding CsgD family transcriptional regulator